MNGKPTRKEITEAIDTLKDTPIAVLQQYQSGLEQLLTKLKRELEKGASFRANQKEEPLSRWDQERLKAEQRKKELEERVNRIMRETENLMLKEYQGSEIVRPSVAAKAAYYRTKMLGGNMTAVSKAHAGLGAIPASSENLGHGESLLPTNLSRELLTEPVEENSLRRIEPISQIRGLEEPKIDFAIEDATLDDVTDEDTANEIKMTGDTVSYGRFKTKIVATVKDTVLYGTDLELVSNVEAALRSGLAIKEKINAFRTAADGTHDHMSFYLNGIKEVEGPNMVQAVINAWADLPEAFSGNACAVMRKQDYYSSIQTLANGATSLWGANPEDVVGIPVIFNDRAVTPVVGDFRYARQNYDIGAILDTDKDAKKGEYYFVLTAWGDHRIRIKNAFRLAKVTEGAAG